MSYRRFEVADLADYSVYSTYCTYSVHYILMYCTYSVHSILVYCTYSLHSILVFSVKVYTPITYHSMVIAWLLLRESICWRRMNAANYFKKKACLSFVVKKLSCWVVVTLYLSQMFCDESCLFVQHIVVPGRLVDLHPIAVLLPCDVLREHVPHILTKQSWKLLNLVYF